MTPDTENQLATLIDLTGTVPLIAPLRECVRHFTALKIEHRADARILLTQPVARAGQKTRTWLLEPAEIAALAARFADEESLAG
ncbi:hypothetical protein G4G27_00725 [Sphingomonas sp. So64.6b]|uniref:hypothetical protein n=1 Tax=Sphingomonas sp. So64.6b TaxID=2997354 RepID=UPI001603911A|nr:hypothetical protein [Sphingomonas sp. So64.6b]QNA82694.1 hypothetical protein G4G27_00725 [Sphingomonas sp. So64.6b]